MINSWLPGLAALAWMFAFVWVLVVHAWHVAVWSGAHRIWHCGHLLMALGMIIMFAPTRVMVVSASVGIAVFVVAALALAGYLMAGRITGRGIGPLWVLSGLDLAWMAYMFAPSGGYGVSWVSVVGALYFAAQALGWAGGSLGQVLDRHGLGSLQDWASVEGRRGDRVGGVDGGSHDWPVRVSLALMAVGMAYMLLATTYGMSAMSDMPVMSGPHGRSVT